MTKPIPAIVEAAVDLKRVTKEVDAAWRAYQGAQEAFAARRLALGRALARARPSWPARGPTAKGWGTYLAERGIDQDVALEAMRYAGYVDEDPVSRDLPGNLPTRREAGLDPDPADERANVKGGSGETARGTWCTSKDWAVAVGPWDHDPFSNPRSKIASVTRCMLEDGGDGFGGVEPGSTPGLYLTGDRFGQPISAVAGADTRVFIQPPFDLVAAAIAHYGHTRFCALLRWSPDVKAWFPALWERTAVVCHPFGERMEFEPPPGIDTSGDMPFPHALYYADERDVTDAVRARCLVWRIDHALDCATSAPAGLHLVRP